MPKVLIADELSPAAVQVFRNRGLEVDEKVGLKPKELRDIIGAYDGLAIRSATKVTPEVIAVAKNLEGGGSRRHRHRQHRPQGRDRRRHLRDEHAVRQLDHHRRARHRHDDGARPAYPAGRPHHPGRQVGEVEVRRGRALRQDARPDRLRQHRIDRRRPRPGPQDEGDRLRSLPVARPRARSRRREGGAGRALHARRFHLAAHAADRADPRHDQQGLARQVPAGHADHQLRPRRPDRGGRSARGAGERPCRWRGRGRVLGGAGYQQCPVQPSARGDHAASRRVVDRGAAQRRAAGGGADGGLSAARRRHQRAQHAVGDGGGSAAPAAVPQARRAARLLRRAGDGRPDQAHRGRVRGPRRLAQHQAADRDHPAGGAARLARQRQHGQCRRTSPRSATSR